MSSKQFDRHQLPEPPLTGLIVLELGTIIAGPFCGSLLAELGATVIKVEAPSGDGLRRMGPTLGSDSVWWGVSSRNKRCISLDLKNASGRALLKQLVRKAHVLSENYRPGVLEKLGFGVSELATLNPELIVLRISGYGQSGPWSQKPGFGKIAEGLSGIAELTGKRDGRPLFMGFSLADTAAGLFGAFGIVAALLAKKPSGPKLVDVALYEPLMRMLEPRFNLPHLRRSGTNLPLNWGSGEGPRYMFLRTAADTWLQVEQSDGMPSLVGESWCKPKKDHTYFETSLALDVAITRLKGLKLAHFVVFDGRSMMASPYFERRNDVVTHCLENDKKLHTPGFVPKAYRRGEYRAFRSPAVGEDNRWVAEHVIGLDEATYHGFADRGAFGHTTTRTQ